MALNRAKGLSDAELSVWKCDADTELPSEGSEQGSEAHSDFEFQFVLEQPHSCPGGLGMGGVAGGAAAAQAGGGGGGAESEPQPLRQLQDHDWRMAAFLRHGGPPKALFLDYDGTLREFEARPELAVPTPELHSLLAALSDREDLAVHIISGRDAHFLITHLGCHGRLTLIAEHERRLAGRFQVWRPDAEVAWGGRRADAQEWWTPARRELNRATASAAGSQVEEKASSLVWHYRGVADVEAGEAAAGLLAARLERLKRLRRFRDFRVSLGHKTVEVSCRSVTKGEVMRRICDTRTRFGQPFEAVMVAGDDVSDESMFEVALEDTLTVKVGEDKTSARYRVDSPGHLREFLWRLAA